MHFCVELCKYFINEWRHTFYLTKNGQEFTKYIRSFMTAIMLYLERWKRIFLWMSQHYGSEPVNFTITFERPGNLNSSKHYKTLKDSGNSSTKSMIIGISWHCSTPRRECMLWQQFTCTVELVFDHFFALYRTLLVFFLVTTINLCSVNSQKRPK